MMVTIVLKPKMVIASIEKLLENEDSAERNVASGAHNLLRKDNVEVHGKCELHRAVVEATYRF